MSEIWVLSIKTSLPKTCRRNDQMKTVISAFDSFEKGRDAMREKIKEYAFSKNTMFDGAGRVIILNKYIKDGLNYFKNNDDELLLETYKVFSSIQDTLSVAFSGQNTAVKVTCGKYDDWNIAVKVTRDTVRFYNGEGGDENGYNPVLTTNIISTEKEQDYYLYINDMFGQDGDSSELYVDLKKIPVS